MPWKVEKVEQLLGPGQQPMQTGEYLGGGAEFPTRHAAEEAVSGMLAATRTSVRTKSGITGGAAMTTTQRISCWSFAGRTP